MEIWQRFPKFILGFLFTFVVTLALVLGGGLTDKLAPAVAEANTFRMIFFILTFFSIGVLSDFRKLWRAGIGKLASVCVVSLFGFVVWVGLAISFVFFAGVKPPLAG
jgi:magnesium-transporting ATPase (P-type)